MKRLEIFKRIAPYVAGVLFILYALIGLLGNPSFTETVICVALVALGVSSMIDRAEQIGFVSLLVVAVFGILTFVMMLVSIFINLFQIYFSPGFIFRQFLWLIPAMLNVLSKITMTILSLLCLQKRSSFFDKFTKLWFVPGAILLVATVLSVALSLLDIVGFSINFSYLLVILKNCIVDMILIIGFVSYGLSVYLKK